MTSVADFELKNYFRYINNNSERYDQDLVAFANLYLFSKANFREKYLRASAIRLYAER